MSDNNNEINSEDNISKLMNLLTKCKEVMNIQKTTIKTLNETIDIFNQIIELKDDTIDRQLQMLQLMELKLKEFGVELGSTI